MSTAKAIGGSVLQLPDPAENYSLPLLNQNFTNIADEVNKSNTAIAKLAHAEFTGGAIAYPNSAPQWGVGTLTADTASTPNVTYNNTFVVYSVADTLKILETGVYFFQWMLSASSLPPAGEMAIKNNTTGAYVANDDLANGVSYTAPLQGVAFCSANDLISFYTFNRTGAFSGTSRLRVTKLQG